MGRAAISNPSAIRATDRALSDKASVNAQPTGPPPAMATSTSGGSTTADQRLDIPDRFRGGCRQYLAPGDRYDDVVFDAHARVPELPGHVVGRPNVAARLHGQGHARLEAAPLPARFVFSGVSDVQAEPMPGAMHVEALVILGLDHFFDGAVAQPQIDESSSESLHRSIVRFIPA